MKFFKKILIRCKITSESLLLLFTKDTSPYWEKRAKKFGSRSVLNLGHSEDEMESVTENQKDLLFPIMQKTLTGKEKIVLDFGCGPGRFTKELADLIKGKCIGVDTTQYLLEIAPKGLNVEYRKIDQTGIIPVETNSIDVIWICLVLGGLISNKLLHKTIKEMDRVLKHSGTVILIENTMNEKSTNYWKFRTIEFYLNLFKNYSLKHENDYYDLGQRISIFTGKKKL